MTAPPPRPRSTLLTVLVLWFAFYCSFTLFTPALLDDADSVHAEVAREMLLRHDWVTLYANGIRYLEKAPLLYWSMAACMRLSSLLGATSPRAFAAAARIPLALAVLALALVCEAFARRMFRSAHAGLYAALILLSSFGIFIFTRITIPDVMVCLWLTVALYAFWRTEEYNGSSTDVSSGPERETRSGETSASRRLRQEPYALHSAFYPLLFSAACAFNVLTKGLIGIVFPIGIVLIYLLLTRGFRGTWQRLCELHPLASLLVFFAIAAPWHILAGLANPTQGHPDPFLFVNGHWQVPLPNDGNVRGWFWFYFMNEHVLRYLNLRVPRDYDTAPLWLFWGLCLVWMMPWSAFAFKAVANSVPVRSSQWRSRFRSRTLPPKRLGLLLAVIWAGLPLVFFSVSTRQEYYVLPALPALGLLVAEWLADEASYREKFGFRPAAYSRFRWKYASADEKALGETRDPHSSAARTSFVLLVIGTTFAFASFWFVLHMHPPAPDTDLATLLAQNPGDYALSMGHFLDLNAQALGLFRFPLALAATSLFGGPLISLLLRRGAKPHAANLALGAGAFGFLLAAHLGLRTFSPVLTSAQLAQAIAPQVHPQDLIVLHGEYEAGSTLGFYLQRPASYAPQPNAAQFIHILEGRSSNLWYGSFFPDAPRIFETPQSIAAKWNGPQRIFMWQSTTDEPRNLPPLPGPVYVLAQSGGKEIVSNQPNR